MPIALEGNEEEIFDHFWSFDNYPTLGSYLNTMYIIYSHCCPLRKLFTAIVVLCVYYLYKN